MKETKELLKRILEMFIISIGIIFLLFISISATLYSIGLLSKAGINGDIKEICFYGVIAFYMGTKFIDFFVNAFKKLKGYLEN
ncbi:MAG: hypothetical protein WC758_08040 [Candidatus Woesearchaeota archaeon]|jgi:type III secretory pathway component EscU